MSTRRTLLLGALVGVLALGIGTLVAWVTFPTSAELQDRFFEELGLSGTLFDNPMVRDLVDQVSDRVEGRVADEARRSALLGGLAGSAVAVGGVALVLADARRRDAAAAAPAPVSTSEPTSGPPEDRT